jgi:hypothetical protein
MERMFKESKLGTAKLVNRFVFPPIKLAYGNPNGTVTEKLEKPFEMPYEAMRRWRNGDDDWKGIHRFSPGP